MDKKKRAKSNREEEKKVALKRDAKQGYREVVRKFGLNFELFKLCFDSTTWLVPFRVTMGMELFKTLGIFI